jgi:hypothetical protein
MHRWLHFYQSTIRRGISAVLMHVPIKHPSLREQKAGNHSFAQQFASRAHARAERRHDPA